MKNISAYVSFELQMLAALLVFSLVATQTAFAAAPQAPPAAPAPISTSAASSSTQSLTVPTGTVIPLTLVSQIKSKSTKVGDTVRAQVAFPITAGSQVAIPAGTYVEGIVTSLTAQAKKTRQPNVQIHFTRLVYANGYTAVLDAANTQANNHAPGAALQPLLSEAYAPNAFAPGRTHIAFYGGEGFASAAQTPTLPTEPTMPGPPMGAVIGGVLGALAAFLVVGILVGHHRMANTDFLLFDAGWQFQMALATPLALDAAQVATAANAPAH